MYRRVFASAVALLAVASVLPAVGQTSDPAFTGVQSTFPPPSPTESFGSEGTASLVLPTASQPGYMQMPDGRHFQIISGTAPAVPPAATLSTAAAGGGAGGAGGEAAGAAESDNGTNPAQNTTTFIAANEYYSLSGGNQINTTYARLKFPIMKGRGAFLFETPYVFYDFTATDERLPQVGGLGDVKLQANYNTWSSPDKKLTLINFLEFYVPSADTAIVGRLPDNEQLTAFNLGTGQYVLGPGVGLVYAIQPNFIIAPLYFYEASVAGDENRPEVNRGKLRIFSMYALENGLYTLPEFQLLTNYDNSNHDAYFAPEFGYSTKGTTMYAKPGIGIEPDLNDREWGFEFGARIQF